MNAAVHHDLGEMPGRVVEGFGLPLDLGAVVARDDALGFGQRRLDRRPFARLQRFGGNLLEVGTPQRLFRRQDHRLGLVAGLNQEPGL